MIIISHSATYNKQQMKIYNDGRRFLCYNVPEGRDTVIRKAYVEITNACNLACEFCHGTKRPIHFLTEAEFRHAATQAKSFADYLFFHLMGEPLLHPNLERFLEIAGELDFPVILTTNGTLLPQKAEILLNTKKLHKVSISLHCYEANQMGISLEDYLQGCFDFCKKAGDRGIYAVLRLWNQGGADRLNERILAALERFFPEPWVQTRSGHRVYDHVFLEWGERFDWPDPEAEVLGENHGCYGLRDQIGILSDGTVVPCCLDAEGGIPLGNVFRQELCEILASPRAVAMKKGLQNRRVTEELCRRCGYAHQKQY